MPLDILPIFYLCAIFILHILYLFSSFFQYRRFFLFIFVILYNFIVLVPSLCLFPLLFYIRRLQKHFFQMLLQPSFSPIIFFIRWNSVQFLCASLFLFFFQLSPDRIFRCCHCLQGHGKKLFKFPVQLLCTSFNDFS